MQEWLKPQRKMPAAHRERGRSDALQRIPLLGQSQFIAALLVSAVGAAPMRRDAPYDTVRPPCPQRMDWKSRQVRSGVSQLPTRSNPARQGTGSATERSV